MPSFPERESSILAVLKKKKPGRVPENEIRTAHNSVNHQPDTTTATHVSFSNINIYFNFNNSIFIWFSMTVSKWLTVEFLLY